MKPPTITKNNIYFNPFIGGPTIEKVIYTTQSQVEIWIDCKIGGEDANRAYNESISLILEGELSISALENAVQKLVKRHEALRAVFSPDGRFMSVLHYVPVEIEHLNFSQSSSSNIKSTLSNYLLDDVNYIFDLVKGPLFKVGLIKINDLEHQLIITAHHIICDGWSVGVILEELGALYSASVTNVNPSLPKVDDFSSYADELHAYIGSEAHLKTEKFWLDQYKTSVPKLTLPTDFSRPKLRTYKSNRLDFSINKEVISRLKKVGVKSGCSFVTTLMAAFEVFLFKQSGQDDIVLGLPSAGQSVTGKTQLIGHCVNLLPLRSKLDASQSFSEYLKHRKLSILDAYDHQQLSFGELLQILPLRRDPSRVPLVPVVFNIDIGMTSQVKFTNLKYKLITNPRTFEAFELFLNASGTEEDFILEWSYNSTLFTSSTIKQMMVTFEEILDLIIENSTHTIAEIIKIDEAAYNQLNDTEAIYPNLPLHELLSKQAKVFYKKQAIKFDETEISYEKLEQQVNQLAHRLSSIGVSAGDFVGVCLSRSIELVITLRAIMQCGAAYIPLDPSYPLQRLNYMLDDSESKFLISTSIVSSKLSTNATVLILDDLFLNLSDFPKKPISIKVDPEDIAYLIYTSGSTGKPKGVAVTHKNLVNFLYSMMEKPGIKETDRLLSITTISFDIVGLELFLPLLSGATLVLANDETVKDGRIMLDLIKDEGVTILQATPTTWQMLLDIGWNIALPIKALSGGEPLSLSLSKRLLANVSELWNMYGPTETTIWSSTKQILRDEDVITIGNPIANTQVYILNEQNILMEPGKTGEIVIGGDGVSEGYWKRLDLTNEKFFNNPFAIDSNTKLFRTGDLGQLLPSGELLCLGRIDHQVKVRGHRIELEEIERIIDVLDDVNHSLVIVKADNLIAYIISEKIDELSKDQVNQWKKAIAEQLPTYMIPQEFHLISEFPMTLNGKVDRNALLNKSTTQVHIANYTSPRNETEHIISEIWCEALNMEKIDVYSNFFELGGHSIIAIKVISQIENKMGEILPLSALMVYPTIEKLASSIDRSVKKQSLGSLVPLKPEGTKTPLYIVHGAHFDVYLFNDLARELDEDQPVYAIQPKGLNGIDEPLDSIYEMAAYYIAKMEISNPDGPYALAGFSMGGIIAYEMAKQLKAKGKKVTMLASFDSYVYPSYFYNNTTKKKIVSFFYSISQMIFISLNMFSSKKNFKRRIKLSKQYIYGLYLRLKVGRERQFKLQHNRTLKMNKKHIIATYQYTMMPEDIVVDLFKAKENVFFAHDFKFLGWKKFALKGVRKHMVPGNHVDMFVSPNVEVYASNLQRVLDNSNLESFE
ncbi:Amino acid adenylation [Flavobacteriales bacterium ALC-1]|nr:Amino acid adenylation [Flavobacteriales bacterium ALC-1]